MRPPTQGFAHTETSGASANTGVCARYLRDVLANTVGRPRAQAGFPEEWMSETFSHMTFGSGIVAILSGIVASFVSVLN